MLSKDDLAEELREKIFVQDYSPQPVIDGVQLKELRNIVGEDGDFSELLRFTHEGTLEEFPGFRVRQVNRSKILPGAIKAWHLHYNQDEIQTVLPEDHLVVGLWDIRQNSPTKGISMKLTLGGGKAHLLHIPQGVAHGYMNQTLKPATVMYFVSEQFDLDNPDELRLPWDANGEDFWQPSRE